MTITRKNTIIPPPTPHLPRLRIYLLVLRLVQCNLLQLMIVQDESCAGGTLVDRADQLSRLHRYRLCMSGRRPHTHTHTHAYIIIKPMS